MDFNPPVYRSSLHLMHDMQREHDVCSETLICFVHSRGREMKKKNMSKREHGRNRMRVCDVGCNGDHRISL